MYIKYNTVTYNNLCTKILTDSDAVISNIIHVQIMKIKTTDTHVALMTVKSPSLPIDSNSCTMMAKNGQDKHQTNRNFYTRSLNVNCAVTLLRLGAHAHSRR